MCKNQKKFIKNTPFINIGKKIEELTPLEFKQTYKGIFSDHFYKIKNHHNLYLGVELFGKLLKLVKQMNYYGLIYDIIQIKDESGKNIIDGPTWNLNREIFNNGYHRIGYTLFLPKRLKRYYYQAGNLNHPFEIKLEYLKQLGKISRCFKVKLLAVCKTDEEMKSTEIFWQLYYNKTHNEKGYDLSINQHFNLIIGDITEQPITYSDIWRGNLMKPSLVIDIINGLTIGALRIKYGALIRVNPNGVAGDTIYEYLEKFFGTHNIFIITTRLIYPYLDKCFKRGFSKEEAYRFLIKSGFKMFDKEFVKELSLLYEKKTINTIGDRLLNSFLDFFYRNITLNKDLRTVGRYELIRKEIYLRHYVKYLRDNGIKDIIKTERQHDESGKFLPKINNNNSRREFTIIENLYIKNVSIDIIGQLLDKSKNEIQYYLRSRWKSVLEKKGIKYGLLALRVFLKSKNYRKMINFNLEE